MTAKQSVKHPILWLLGVVLSVASAGCATVSVSSQGEVIPASSRYSKTLTELDAAIRKGMKKEDIAGLSIAVLDDQTIIWQQGYGMANRELQQAATATTRYRAGSITKVFSSVAAMQLADAGKLDIDAAVTSVIPEFSIKSRFDSQPEITPRQLMTHHAGLPTDYLAGMFSPEPEPFESVIPILNARYLSTPPGTIYSYSNLGFSLLGTVIERASGEAYASYMQRALLQPLGMLNSTIELAGPVGVAAAAGYDRHGKRVEELGLRDMPAGGLNSTAPELLQLAKLWFANGSLNGQTLLSPDSIAAMQQQQNHDVALDLDMRIGLGWHRPDFQVAGAERVLAHSGGTLAHRALLMLLPEHKLAIALMSNSAQSDSLQRSLATQTLQQLLQDKTGVEAPAEPRSVAADARFQPVEPAALTGHYQTELGLATVTLRDGKPVVTLADKTLRMVQQPTGYYTLHYRLLGVIPIGLGELGNWQYTTAMLAGRRVLLACRDGQFYLVGERVEPQTIPSAWQARLGEYVYTGGDEPLLSQTGLTSVELVLRDGLLLAKMNSAHGASYTVLQPLDDQTAVIAGLGRGRGETVTVLQDAGRELLEHAGWRFSRKSH